MSDAYKFQIVVSPENERTEYWFFTDQSLLYYAYFVAAPEYLSEFESYKYLSCFGHVVGFCPLDEEAAAKAPYDPHIGRTICDILIDFIKQHNRVILVYHCDPSDGLQRARKVTFNKWHKAHGAKFELHKSEVEIEVKQTGAVDRKEYLGCLASFPEPEIPLIEAEFRQFAHEKASSNKLPA